ncbi:MAG: hypothetical protein NVS1B9_09250 [Solirubrobacteraceae bacterium]
MRTGCVRDMRRLAYLSLLQLALLAPPARAAAPTLQVGIGDQKENLFSDGRFLALHLSHARRALAWDALTVRYQRREIDSWLAAARRAGVSPLISFDHSRRYRRHKVLPTAAQFRAQFVRFHARYRWVTDFATWNEANYCGEITCHHPDRVAQYYRVMRSVCPRCKVLGAELLDVPGMIAWARAFTRAARATPHYWGLHNYVGANRFSSASTRELLAFSPHSDVWFTETAGLVARRNHSAVHFRQSAAHAANVTQFIFDKLAHLSRHITRIYLYQWDASAADDSWDSALIGLDGRARPALGVLQRSLQKLTGNAPAVAAQPSSGSSKASRVATR